MINMNKIPPSALLVAAYSDSRERHGGARRSLQLVEYFRELYADGFSLLPMRDLVEGHRISIGDLVSVLCRGVRHLLAGRMSIYGFTRYLALGHRLRAEIARRSPDVIYFETAPEWPLLLADVALNSGIPCILIPSNIEFLVRAQAQRSFSGFSAMAGWEVDMYRKSRGVLAISHFDAAVVRCIGGTGEVLEYFPPRDIEVELLDISVARASRCRKSSMLLIAGSAVNPPTRIGMQNILQDIIDIKSDSWNPRIVVAGFGTESLSHFSNDQIAVMGSISDHEMRDLMVECDGLIIAPLQTSGFITRLADANVAGIPVVLIGSYIQAVGLSEYGIKVCERWSEVSSSDFNIQGCVKFIRPSTKIHLLGL